LNGTTTLSITTFIIKIPSIKGVFATLSINDARQMTLSVRTLLLCCHALFIAVQNVIM